VGTGGIGLTSSLNGVTYARGGNGGGYTVGYGIDGVANTGNGGGGSGPSSTLSTSGGSGIIIIKIPAANTATFTAGVSQTSVTSGGFKTITITAAGVSDTVTLS
jgi:hypothetical protein